MAGAAAILEVRKGNEINELQYANTPEVARVKAVMEKLGENATKNVAEKLINDQPATTIECLRLARKLAQIINRLERNPDGKIETIGLDNTTALGILELTKMITKNLIAQDCQPATKAEGFKSLLTALDKLRLLPSSIERVKIDLDAALSPTPPRSS